MLLICLWQRCLRSEGEGELRFYKEHKGLGNRKSEAVWLKEMGSYVEQHKTQVTYGTR